MKQSVRKLFAAMALLMIALMGKAGAEEALWKPFILGSSGPGSITEKTAATRASLTSQGFTIVGEYAPYPDAVLLITTNSDLKANAAKSEHGGFGAAIRVSITRIKNDVQVAYANPVYMANVYRMQGDLAGVAAKLAAALGKREEFGAQGLSAKKLRSYHYMVGMEYFTEPSVLAEYAGYDAAVAAVEAGLAAGKGGVTKVFRIDLSDKKETVFGVAMKGATEADKYMDDKFIMSEIDFKDPRSTAHLPYEMLVSGNKIYALYARFRIASSFPDLSMMGSNSFMNIMKTPEAIRKALVQAAGGKL